MREPKRKRDALWGGGSDRDMQVGGSRKKKLGRKSGLGSPHHTGLLWKQ